jgi:hypothetical protein
MGLRLTAFIFLSAYILFLIGVHPILRDVQARASQAGLPHGDLPGPSCVST